MITILNILISGTLVFFTFQYVTTSDLMIWSQTQRWDLKDSVAVRSDMPLKTWLQGVHNSIDGQATFATNFQLPPRSDYHRGGSLVLKEMARDVTCAE